ncbi:MAG: hypothetical protein EPO52_17705 [Herbiconiux sp.]|uniref:hypothetical protein n=1 Tax=Herbiconiux sp. TaxID=1871186 RepID=UPI0012236737|nr:hypothetical protein [Herbiconiux sp.]TAJ46369.1 MAG: hypothetical protein EPO52_17705 [Herbiconiux sp.]
MAEEPSIAVLVERISNVQKSVDDIKKDMATKGDQTNTHDVIGRVEVALANEVTARVTAVKEVAARLQLVEDRMEARKYGVGIAIVISVIGSVVGVIIK